MIEIGASVVDTDVFSLLYLRRGSIDPRAAGWRDILRPSRSCFLSDTGRGARGRAIAEWGDRRMRRCSEILERTPTIHSDDDVVDAFSTLVAECRELGLALHGRAHEAIVRLLPALSPCASIY